MKMTTRTTQVFVLPEGQPLYSEDATQISITDEAAGEFVVLDQSGRSDMGKIAITPEEWPTIREQVDMMISECRDSTRTCGACGKAGCVAGECSTVGINGLTEAETGVAQTAIHTLNKAFEDGLEALRVCTGEMLSQRTKGKVERAITAMCNAMPILDLVEGVNVKELGGLTTIYQQLLPVESSGKKAA
ncbi:MAG TPA: hypothetical protein DDX06_10975 [Curvibacter sp.]|nr:hypothetical protein [Curvibacter sp.]|tara:strand:+ start:473 stop:1039 length:567 start_codon:yes stop_codon:yes gene_type:complete